MAWDGFVGRCDDLDYSELEEMEKDADFGLWSEHLHHWSARRM